MSPQSYRSHCKMVDKNSTSDASPMMGDGHVARIPAIQFSPTIDVQEYLHFCDITTEEKLAAWYNDKELDQSIREYKGLLRIINKECGIDGAEEKADLVASERVGCFWGLEKDFEHRGKNEDESNKEGKKRRRRRVEMAVLTPEKFRHASGKSVKPQRIASAYASVCEESIQIARKRGILYAAAVKLEQQQDSTAALPTFTSTSRLIVKQRTKTTSVFSKLTKKRSGIFRRIFTFSAAAA